MIRVDPIQPDIPTAPRPRRSSASPTRPSPPPAPRAAEVAQRVEDGEDFASLAKRFSADEDTRERGGELPQGFDHRRLPEVLVKEIDALQPGQTTPAIEVGISHFLFELVAREETPLEDVSEALKAELAQARPSMVEVAGYRNVLTRDMVVEVLPALFD